MKEMNLFNPPDLAAWKTDGASELYETDGSDSDSGKEASDKSEEASKSSKDKSSKDKSGSEVSEKLGKSSSNKASKGSASNDKSESEVSEKETKVKPSNKKSSKDKSSKDKSGSEASEVTKSSSNKSSKGSSSKDKSESAVSEKETRVKPSKDKSSKDKSSKDKSSKDRSASDSSDASGSEDGDPTEDPKEADRSDSYSELSDDDDVPDFNVGDNSTVPLGRHIGEYGRAHFKESGVLVHLQREYTHPVIILGALEHKKLTPKLPSVRNLAYQAPGCPGWCFELWAQTASCWRSVDHTETVGFLAAEAGVYDFDGGRLEVGSAVFDAAVGEFQRVAFDQTFDAPPVVIAQKQGSLTYSVARLERAPDAHGFDVTLQGEGRKFRSTEAPEANTDDAVVGYIALSEGAFSSPAPEAETRNGRKLRGQWNKVARKDVAEEKGTKWQSIATPAKVHHKAYSVPFAAKFFSNPPIVFAQTATFKGKDAGRPRLQSVSPHRAQLFYDEDGCDQRKHRHHPGSESFHVLALSQRGGCRALGNKLGATLPLILPA